MAKRARTFASADGSCLTPKKRKVSTEDDEDLTLSEKRRRAVLKGVEARANKKAERLDLQAKESLASLDNARQVIRERDFPTTGAMVDPVACNQILEEAFGKHKGTISAKVWRAMVIGADCFLRAQSNGLEAHAKVPEPDEIDVDAGEDNDEEYFWCLKWSWDETTTRLYVDNKEDLDRLMSEVGIPPSCLRFMRGKTCLHGIQCDPAEGHGAIERLCGADLYPSARHRADFIDNSIRCI